MPLWSMDQWGYFGRRDVAYLMDAAVHIRLVVCTRASTNSDPVSSSRRLISPEGRPGGVDVGMTPSNALPDD
jgi:hypothetical protein